MKCEMLIGHVCVRIVSGRNLVERKYILVEILMTMSQPMNNLEFGKCANQKSLLCCVCYSSYPAKQTPDFHWATLARCYHWSVLGPLGLGPNHLFYIETLSLPFVLAVSSCMSCFQKSRGFRSQMFETPTVC